jgi:protein TonB
MNAATPSTSSLRWAIVLVLGVGLAACNKDQPPAPATGAAPAAAAVPDAAAQAAAAQQAAALAALPADELKKRGADALREQRLYSPAGNNAMEYYIALRKKSDKPNASAESALIDLEPYAVIAAEQAITREDFVEADRLHSLIASADAQAPALGRIADAILKGKQAVALRQQQVTTQTDQAAKATEAARLQAQQQAQQAAAAPAPTPVAAPPPPPAPVRAPPVETAPAPVVSAPPPPPPARNSSALVQVYAPQPAYPPDARRSGTTGEVVVTFTVNTDGSVGNVDITTARPRGVFERNVRAAVARWKFQPIDSPQTVTRTFSFTL